MAMPDPSSPAILSGEILAEAERECDELLRRARQEAESLLASAKVAAEKIRQETVDTARAEAARRGELVLATVPVEARRRRSARVEAILEGIHEEARRQLRTHNFDHYEVVVTLAAEAIGHMPGTGYVLKMSAADYAAFGGKVAGEIARRTGCPSVNVTASADPAMTDGGVIVQDAEGTQIWDNRLHSRLERLWPELRREIFVRSSLAEKGGLAGGVG